MVGNVFDVTRGAYAGRKCLVTVIHSHYPTFAQVVILNTDGTRSKTSDMIPVAYLTPTTVDGQRASTLRNSGNNGRT